MRKSDAGADALVGNRFPTVDKIFTRLRDFAIISSTAVLACATACASGTAVFLAANPHGSSDETSYPAKGRVIDVGDMLSIYQLGGMVGEGLNVSPDGKFVAFQMHRADLDENAYVVGWYVLDLAKKGVPTRVADAGDPLLFRAKVGNQVNGAWRSTQPVWSPDSRWIAYRRKDGDSVQVWRAKFDGAVSEQLTQSEAPVDAFYWSKDGNQIWFETDATAQERAVYLRSLSASGFWAGDAQFDPTTNIHQIHPYELTSGRPRLWVADISTKRAKPASEEEAISHFGSNTVSSDVIFARYRRSLQIPGRPLSRQVTASRDGNSVAWLESQVRAVYPILQVRVRLGSEDELPLACNLDPCFGQIKNLWWSGNGQEIVFIRGEDPNRGRNVVYAWHIHDNAVRKVYEDDSRHLSACSSTGLSLICFSDDAKSPRVLVEVDFADGTLSELYDPNPSFHKLVLGEAERVTWVNAFQIETFGWLLKPVGYSKGQRYPLVIIQYRARNCFSGGTGAEYPAHLFTAQGFVVLCFDQPQLWSLLETMDLMEYQQAVWKGYYEKRVILSSLQSAIQLLDTKGVIDPSKVGITGISSGANTTTYALINSNHFSAAIVAGLGWSPIDYFLTAEWIREINRKWGFGRIGTVYDKYRSGMILGMNIGKVHTPLLIQVSDDEAHASIYNYVTLRENGAPVDMYVFPGEYHIKWFPQHRKAVAVRAVDWMRFWLRAEEDAHPAKAEQYARWRELREESVPLSATALSLDVSRSAIP